MAKIMEPHTANTPAINLPEPPLSHGSINHAQSHTNDHTQGSSVGLPTTAVSIDDGSDVLDQEWVDKAKAIVEHTKSDPFSESLELSKMKADYLKVRYNKHIKVTEDNA